MRDKLVLRFLGFLETMKYILEQSHGVPPVSVALDHITFKEEGSCGYSSVKTVRSIDIIHCNYAFCPTAKYSSIPTTGSSSTIKTHSSLPSPDIELTRMLPSAMISSTTTKRPRRMRPMQCSFPFVWMETICGVCTDPL